MGGHDGCTLWTYLVPLNCALKMIKLKKKERKPQCPRLEADHSPSCAPVSKCPGISSLAVGKRSSSRLPHHTCSREELHRELFLRIWTHTSMPLCLFWGSAVIVSSRHCQTLALKSAASSNPTHAVLPLWPQVPHQSCQGSSLTTQLAFPSPCFFLPSS